MTPTEAALTAEILRRIGPELPPRLGVAVSGGSDSLALLYLMAALCRDQQTDLHVASVDHGLRAESRQEAETVASHAHQLGLSHDILTWQQPDTSGNLQAAARAARYRLLAEWARGRGIDQVAVGHTADDQAETVLMRLRRASGVSGLSAMPLRHRRDGIELLRPLLGLRRVDLRAYLDGIGVHWIDDPSNIDGRFERVRVRDALRTLEPLGLTVEALTAVADNMRMADEALDQMARRAMQDLAQERLGAVGLEREGFFGLPEEVARRLLIAAVQHVVGGAYPPRRSPVLAALSALMAGRSATLQGCHIVSQGGKLWLCREYQPLRDLRLPMPGQRSAWLDWDDSWRLTSPDATEPDTELRALGEEGLAQLEDWRQHHVPREVLLPLPSLWRAGQLRAVPLLDPTTKWATLSLRSPLNR
nr:tRNA lysidine(34) synthetase TilS [Phaeobacter sp. HF9A]